MARRRLMRTTSWVAATAAIAIWLPCVSAAAQPATQPAREDGQWISLREAPLVVELPRSITPTDLARYAVLLALSDEQRLFVDRQFEEYLQRCRRIESDRGPGLVALMAPLEEGPFDRAYAINFRLYREAERKFTAAIVDADESFFAAVQSVLSVPQLELLPRVELHRQRGRCVRFPWEVAKARIDLANVVEQMQLPAELMQALDPVLVSYEQSITSLGVAMSAMRAETEERLIELVAAAEYDDAGNPLPADDPRRAELAKIEHDESRAILARRADLQERMCRINDEYIPKCAAQLPGPNAAALQAIYNAMAFRRVYPDRTDPRELFDALVAHKAIDDDFRVVLRDRWAQYRTKYESLCRQMCDESLRWQMMRARTQESAGSGEHEAIMDRMTFERMDLNADFVRSIKNTLPPEVPVAEKVKMDKWLDQLTIWRNREQSRTRGGVMPD